MHITMRGLVPPKTSPGNKSSPHGGISGITRSGYLKSECSLSRLFANEKWLFPHLVYLCRKHRFDWNLSSFGLFVHLFPLRCTAPHILYQCFCLFPFLIRYHIIPSCVSALPILKKFKSCFCTPFLWSVCGMSSLHCNVTVFSIVSRALVALFRWTLFHGDFCRVTSARGLLLGDFGLSLVFLGLFFLDLWSSWNWDSRTSDLRPLLRLFLKSQYKETNSLKVTVLAFGALRLALVLGAPVAQIRISVRLFLPTVRLLSFNHALIPDCVYLASSQIILWAFAPPETSTTFIPAAASLLGESSGKLICQFFPRYFSLLHFF